MRDSLPKIEEVSDFTTPAIKAFLGRDDISLTHCLGVSCERALVHDEEGVQKPVYYVSHSMNRSQTKYQKLEKSVFALFIILRKFKHYFQTFPAIVLTEHPLRSIMKTHKQLGGYQNGHRS